MKWVSTPKVQAQQAISFGETPANTKACPFMDKIQKGACAQYHADASTDYFNSIHFWKTPTKDCKTQSDGCTDYNQWQRKWTEIKG
jgi:putative spermidine/putrescine transport system substrate-binding protein